ncbi:hypothetical protein [Streptomyces sp. UNOC14_S4]|uniref:hypothetical protein n=1 Tax=Streptomyces sp. UNOC14_S4 TaxID=2872340 RepID=UPI001E49BEAC|nr:hypothetical protein [Streptomyces sp. UNOC14_S4]MCC3768419.1 hypothetical protein [Streptomyces sp. UNOC14_S4]
MNVIEAALAPTTAVAAGRGATARAECGLRHRRRTSVKWAVAVPGLATLGGWCAQYPNGLWFTIPLGFATVGAAAGVAGGEWRRPGAATVTCLSAFGLLLFAGPALHDLYAKELGDPVDAVVARAGAHRNAKGTERATCTVIDTSGAVHRLSEQQNCMGQFRPLQQVTLLRDPAGLLGPYVVEPGDRTPDTAGLDVSAGLFALTGTSMLTAGLRRR